MNTVVPLSFYFIYITHMHKPKLSATRGRRNSFSKFIPGLLFAYVVSPFCFYTPIFYSFVYSFIPYCTRQLYILSWYDKRVSIYHLISVLRSVQLSGIISFTVTIILSSVSALLYAPSTCV